jgi:hypothetical protein
MTEAEWLTSGCRMMMRRAIRSRPFSPARWVRFNLACLHRARDLVQDERCLRAIRELEEWTAGPNRHRVRSFHHEAVREAIRELWRRRDDPLRFARVSAARGVLVADLQGFGTSEMVVVARGRQAGKWSGERRAERRVHADILRDIFGNPFRPVVFEPTWRTDTAVSLARGMYDSRDFAAMPILADALQDAGCDRDDILSHCRDPHQAHVRGCWVVDLVLGKE